MNYTRDKKEPFWWGMFAFGGVVAAMLVPIHIFIDGLAIPLGLIGGEALSHQKMLELVRQPLVKIYLFILVVPPLYQAAHRIRFSLYELGVKEFRLSMDFICYGGALFGTALAAYILFMI